MWGLELLRDDWDDELTDTWNVFNQILVYFENMDGLEENILNDNF